MMAVIYRFFLTFGRSLRKPSPFSQNRPKMEGVKWFEIQSQRQFCESVVVKLFTPLAFLRKHKHNKTRRPE